MSSHIEIVRVGLDPFGRNEVTVFYRNKEVCGGKEVFYCWLDNWPEDYPKPNHEDIAWQNRKAKSIRNSRVWR